MNIIIRIECILLKFHWGMKALIELHFQHEALPRFIENVLWSTLSYPNETSKECIQFLNIIILMEYRRQTRDKNKCVWTTQIPNTNMKAKIWDLKKPNVRSGLNHNANSLYNTILTERTLVEQSR